MPSMLFFYAGNKRVLKHFYLKQVAAVNKVAAFI